jgi:serine/threonine protein kinase
MTDEGKCPHCGKPVPPTALEGICPECMLKAGFATQGEESGDVYAAKTIVAPPPASEIAKLFPQLEIIEALGRGGMGAVYKARQARLDRFVALKILSPERQLDPQFAERFEREARTLARLNHPNIVTVYDFGEVQGQFYLLMEFVDGVTLRQLLQSRKLLADEALGIVPRICEALQYAHQQGVVHRDIKPENLLLDKRGQVKIADFGIAKIIGQSAARGLTDERQVIGTPHYMAPEQIEKPKTVDHRADIFSLGVVFYEMLTGELPLGKFALPSKKVHVDVRLDEVVLRALEKEPERRYQQAGQVKSDVETIATTPNQFSPQEQRRTMKSKAFWIGLSAGLGAVLVSALIYFLVHGRVHVPPAELTQKGWQQWQSQKFGEAIDSFGQAVKLDPKDVNAWNGLGWACFNSGQRPKAEEAFKRVVSLQPDHPAALNGLGQIYLAEKNYPEAETCLLKAAPQAPAAWYGLARLYLIQGKFEQAQEWAQKVVDSGQGDDSANKMLAAAKEKHLNDALRVMIEPR